MPSTAAAISSRVVPCHKLKMRCPTGGTVSVQGMTCITATPSGRWPALIAFVRSITGNGTVDVTLSTTDITWTNIVSHANEGYGDGARCVCVWWTGWTRFPYERAQRRVGEPFEDSRENKIQSG